MWNRAIDKGRDKESERDRRRDRARDRTNTKGQGFVTLFLVQLI